MKDIYTFNLLSLFAFSSVLMTYFGVNYYLSGLHSYAGGDAVAVPVFVYVAVIALATLSVVAYMKYRKWKKQVKYSDCHLSGAKMVIPGRLQTERLNPGCWDCHLHFCSDGDPGEGLQTEKAESRHAGISPYFYNSLSEASFRRS
jgi:hypothetical protein